jgi:hypothetical protein
MVRRLLLNSKGMDSNPASLKEKKLLSDIGMDSDVNIGILPISE